MSSQVSIDGRAMNFLCEIKSFVKFIHEFNCDMVVFVARKMYCLHLAIMRERADDVDLSTVQGKKIFIQNNALPFYQKTLKEMRILLVDDLAITGFSLQHYRELLTNKYGVKDENLYTAVLAREYDTAWDFSLAQQAPYYSLSNLRKYSRDIINFIWDSDVPYVSWLPVFDVTEAVFESLYLHDDWAMERIDTVRDTIEGYCYLTKKLMFSEVLACLRVYKNRRGNAVVVPFVIIPPVEPESLRTAYKNACQLLQITDVLDVDNQFSEEVQKCVYRILTYIFSMCVFYRFIEDYRLDESSFCIRSELGDYTFPKEWNTKLQTLIAYDEIADVLRYKSIETNYRKYINEYDSSAGLTVDGVENCLNQTTDLRLYFSAMGQIKCFANGLPETVLHANFNVQDNVTYYTSLLTCLDSSVASLHVEKVAGAQTAVIRKGEHYFWGYRSIKKKNDDYDDNDTNDLFLSAISTAYLKSGKKLAAACSSLFPDLFALYSARWENSLVLLPEIHRSVLFKTSLDGYDFESCLNKTDEFGSERDVEMKFIACIESFLPIYVISNMGENLSLDGFVRFIKEKYTSVDTAKTFLMISKEYLK